MTPMRLSLRAGEKIYVNGAVLRVTHKTSLEIMNDATFLLGQHVLQVDDAATPLRQLYFIAQTMLIDPIHAPGCRLIFDESFAILSRTVADPEICHGLEQVRRLMDGGRILDAMKTIRALWKVEDRILAGAPARPDAA